MTDEEIWAVWDEVIGVNTGIDPVPFARAIEAARATAEQSTDAQDAARWRYAVKHWLDEHIATKQADAAIESQRSGDGS